MRRMLVLAGLVAAVAGGAIVKANPAEARSRVFIGATFGGGFGSGYYDPGYYGPSYYAPPPPPPVYYEPAPTYYAPPPQPAPVYVAPRYVPPAPPPVAQTDYCREYTTRITIGGQPREAFGQACMQQDGSWQRVTYPVPVPD